MTEDQSFVTSARAAWERTKGLADQPSDVSTSALAVGMALFATMHVDRLIELAAKAVEP